MMNYYFMNPSLSPYVYGDVSFYPEIENYSKFSSNLQTLSVEKCFIDIKKSSRLLKADWFAVNFGWVGSEVLVDFFSGDGINIVKADFVSQGNLGVEIKKEYYFFEISRRIDCFDYKKSKYEMRRGLVRACAKCVLDEDKIKGEDFFYVENIGNFNLVVSDNFLNRIEKKLDGVDFVNVENAQWRI